VGVGEMGVGETGIKRFIGVLAISCRIPGGFCQPQASLQNTAESCCMCVYNTHARTSADSFAVDSGVWSVFVMFSLAYFGTQSRKDTLKAWPPNILAAKIYGNLSCECMVHGPANMMVQLGSAHVQQHLAAPAHPTHHAGWEKNCKTDEK
jgi:hypothetical protein